MKIKPLLDRVLLEPKENVEKTKGGIILPTVAQEKSQLARVVAVGQGGEIDGKFIEIVVHEGDQVLFSKYAGTEITVDDKKYIVVRQADILAVIE